MGTHSAVFSPVKFGILPLYLHKNALIGGNALIESATFAAIILGTAAGTQFILIDEYGAYIASAIMIITAIVGYYTGLKMPRIRSADPDMHFNWNMFSHMGEVFTILKRQKSVLTYILAASWFWGVAAVFVTLFPLFVKDALRSDHNVYTLVLIIFSVGVGVGSVACAKLLKGKISARYTPIASVVMGICAFDAGMAAYPLAEPGSLYGVTEFITSFTGLRILLDFFLIACAGGLYVVPFFSLIQESAEKSEKSRVIAGNNIINAAFMVFGALYMYFIGKAGAGLDLKQILMLTGVMCLVGAVVIHCVTPDSIFRRRVR
jgi:acyl-[acyl-carrier-protein]-phospholipid O-acyltransferase / long-chain-fatty-acid--[acyl-carrier-protein] ligase